MNDLISFKKIGELKVLLFNGTRKIRICRFTNSMIKLTFPKVILRFQNLQNDTSFYKVMSVGP